MKRKKKPEAGGAAGTKGVRASARAKSVIPIGVRVGGRRLTAGCTLNRGEHGALLICSEDVPVGTEMEVTNLRSHELFDCRVVWHGGVQESGLFGLGVEILSAEPEATGAGGAGEHEEKKP